MSSKRCIALLCAYDGGAFSGFQRQPPLPTIQGALEDALVAVGLKARIEGSGRTDSGVHACRQVVAFRTRETVAPEALPGLLAPHLPEGIEVLRAVGTPYSFHPRHSATSKTYRYLITTGAEPAEWARRFTWTLPDLRGFPTIEEEEVSLDLEGMERFLTYSVGQHDFSLLTHPRAHGKKVRVVKRAEVARVRGGAGYLFTFVASGFLRHQIRNTVGVAASIGLGLTTQEEGRRLLSGEGDRWRGARAPGRGLTLVRVGYREGEDPFEP